MYVRMFLSEDWKEWAKKISFCNKFLRPGVWNTNYRLISQHITYYTRSSISEVFSYVLLHCITNTRPHIPNIIKIKKAYWRFTTQNSYKQSIDPLFHLISWKNFQYSFPSYWIHPSILLIKLTVSLVSKGKSIYFWIYNLLSLFQ